MEWVSPADQIINGSCSFQTLSPPIWHIRHCQDRAMSVTNTRNNLCIAFMGFYKAHTQPSFPAHPPACGALQVSSLVCDEVYIRTFQVGCYCWEGEGEWLPTLQAYGPSWTLCYKGESSVKLRSTKGRFSHTHTQQLTLLSIPKMHCKTILRVPCTNIKARFLIAVLLEALCWPSTPAFGAVCHSVWM